MSHNIQHLLCLKDNNELQPRSKKLMFIKISDKNPDYFIREDSWGSKNVLSSHSFSIPFRLHEITQNMYLR